jgi:surfactin synthase thioesterase subunit
MVAARWWTLMRRATDPEVRVRVLVVTSIDLDLIRPSVAVLPEDIEVLALSLPGRGRRHAEPPPSSPDEVVASLHEVWQRPAAPAVVLGHHAEAELPELIATGLGDTCLGVAGLDGLLAATEAVARKRTAMLVCLPFAGSGAGFYLGWRGLAGPKLAVRALQLPGREERMFEAPVSDVAAALTDLLPQLNAIMRGYPAVALFGHSLGAVLAYELACALSDAKDDRLVHLLVSGAPAPHQVRVAKATGLDDEQFIARVREFAGYQDSTLDDPDMRRLLLPTLRADVQMHEGYRATRQSPLTIPITSLRGKADDLVSASEADGWSEATTAGLHTIEPPGGHMYIIDDPEPVLSAAQVALCG